MMRLGNTFGNAGHRGMCGARSWAAACAAVMSVAGALQAGDWNNLGGNAGRNAQSDEVGPIAPQQIWSGSRSSVIAWSPVIEGRRVFTVRQTGFPPGGEPGGSIIVCQDLDTGTELWAAEIPYQTGDWTTWIAGVKNGRLFASRSGNGASVSDNLYCLDAATGTALWTSTVLIDAGAYDGVVFADNGDPIIASMRTIKRFNALTGQLLWSSNRLCSVSGNCGGARAGNSVYVADAAVGGHVIKKFDLATGAFEYQSPVMAGFTIKNTPFVSPDGTVYLSRVQNNVAVDYFFAFHDSGSAMTVAWSRPAQWSTESDFAVGPDNSVYMVLPGRTVARLNPVDGTIINESAPFTADFLQPRFAVDADGKVFFSNGAFSDGRLFSFNADLTLRWSVPVPNINIGGPALGSSGTLIVAGVGNSLTAYRTPPVCPCRADFDASGGTPDATDIDAFFGAWLSGNVSADADCSGGTPDATDIDEFFTQWLAGGC